MNYLIYFRDCNGNMTHDGIKGMALSYDLNNMPYQVRDEQGNLKAQYTYFADGEKYTQAAITQQNGENVISSSRIYIGPFLLSSNSGSNTNAQGRTFDGANSTEGSFIAYKDAATNSTKFLTTYSVQDHLGSTRVITDASGNVLERNDYYPFGLRTDRGNSYPTLSTNALLASSKPQQLLYNGKELQDIAGTNYIDYGARMYDPVVARWTTTDPMAEKYYNFSEYCYTGNSPIRFSDSEGQDWWDKVKGFVAAVVDDATGGLTNIRSAAAQNVTDPSDFNAGLVAGDVMGLTVGTYESGTGAGMIASGTTVAGAGLVAEGPSLGTSTVVGIGGASVAIGAALTAHGTVMMSSASKNLSEKKGHIKDSDSKVSNKKDNYGTKMDGSKTLFSDSKGNHIDVENPAPGERPGQLHFQDSNNNKYIYNNQDGKFYSKNPQTGKYDIPAPSQVNKQISNPEAQCLSLKKVDS